MKNRFRFKCLHFIKDLALHFGKDFSTYFYKAWQARLIGAYTKSFARSLIFYLNQFRIYLYIGGIQYHHIGDKKIKKLQQTAHDLHLLLPHDARFSYSILIPVNQPHPLFFQESLEAALNQSAPHMEVLIGLMQPLSQEVEERVSNALKNSGKKLQIFNLFQCKEKEQVINQLAEQASGKFQ